MLAAEQLFRIFEYLGLVLGREVQVYIGLLVALEPEERLKRYIMSVSDKISSAHRAFLCGKIEAVSRIRTVFEVLAFRTQIMDRQRVDF